MKYAAVFDQNGRCKYVLDGDPSTVDLSSEAAIVYLSEQIDPNTVWYDHVTGRMEHRSPFRVRVSTNKIEGIPSGTVVHIGADSAVIDEGVLELEVDYPQAVYALLMHVKHTDAYVEVPCEVQG